MSKVLFLDESGDHNLAKVDPQYPIFVLGGVVVENSYAEGEMTQRMNDFKQRVFGSEDIILHTAEIVRTKNKFECLKDNDLRRFFYQELNYLMRSLQYTIIACAIHKDKHLARYGVAALDPYLLSLDMLVERFGYEVGSSGKGAIIAEQRNVLLDNQLKLSWENLKIKGTYHFRASNIRSRFTDLILKNKKDNIAGLQLADLVVSPIGRHILGKKENDDLKIIRQKFRKNKNGVYDGYGLIVLPR